METSGLRVSRDYSWERHLFNGDEKATPALCGAEAAGATRELTTLDLPWLGCTECWTIAAPRIRIGLLE